MKRKISLLLVFVFVMSVFAEMSFAVPRAVVVKSKAVKSRAVKPNRPKPRVVKPVIVKPSPVIVAPAPVIIYNPAPVVVAPPPPARVKPPVAKEPGAEIGLSGGYIAGALGIGGELRVNRLFDLPGITGRVTGAYATDTKDVGNATRKNVLLGADVILNLNPPATPGIRSYVGLGANYDVYTTGQTQGAIGGQAFYGAEGKLGAGDLFLEVGYGIFRPRVSDDRSGMNLLLGYKVGM